MFASHISSCMTKSRHVWCEIHQCFKENKISRYIKMEANIHLKSQ